MITRGGEGHGGLIERVSRWLENQRVIAADKRAVMSAGRDNLDRLASDIGLSSGSDLIDLIDAGPDGAALLGEMAEVLDIPLEAIRRTEPEVVRELEISCSRCRDKGRCVHALQDGTAREHYPEFCPNAATLDALRA